MHLRGDVFRKMIVSGRVDISTQPSDEAVRQLHLRYRLAADAAKAYYDNGFSVVLQDNYYGEEISCISLDDEHRKDVITDPGEWGPWINGGGWLNIDGIAVDILFRDTRKVITVIDDCINGKISIDYQCGHPFGFVNSIYMGEVAYCKILSSNNSLISEQKKRLIEFPENYRETSIEKFLWECEFSEQCGRKAIRKGDILYATGSLFRCAVNLLQDQLQDQMTLEEYNDPFTGSKQQIFATDRPYQRHQAPLVS